MAAAKFTVRTKDLRQGAKVEAQEHPTVSDRLARKIARDHLQKYGPGYYRAEKVNEKVVQNINRRMQARPIRRKPPAPRPWFL